MSLLAVSWWRRRFRGDEVTPGGASVCVGHKQFKPISKLVALNPLQNLLKQTVKINLSLLGGIQSGEKQPEK